MLQEHPTYDYKEPMPEITTLSFGEYELFCNQNNQSSRKSGILSDEIYDATIQDETTVFATIEGVKVPVLVDIKYGLGLGYDENRAKAYAADSEVVSVLAIPIGDLDETSQRAAIRAIASVPGRSIFYADNEGRDSGVLNEGLAASGIVMTETPLSDRRCRVENRQASLSLYLADNKRPDYSLESPRVPLSAAQAIFDSKYLPHVLDHRNAALLRNGAGFSEQELNDIWDLYTNKFQVLGENHPISMEDTRDDFLGTFTSPSTTVSVRYTDGKPVCFTYFTDSFDSLYWLNNDYMKKLDDESVNMTSVFFPGIVARSAGGNHAEEVIKLFANVSADAGINHRIIFENTNLSEMYVPRIVFESVNGTANYSVDKPYKIDQTTYRLATI